MTAEPVATARPLVVALTGGIASGKTAVSDRFAQLGAEVIDTDVIAHDMTAPGAPALIEIREVFGEDVFQDDGQLDRRALRRRIFENREDQDQLEAILHPAIFRTLGERLAQVQSPYCIVVIPLLVETGVPPVVDRVLLVDVEESVQIERLVRRDGVSSAEAIASLNAQSTRRQRLALADDIIKNETTIDALDAQVEALHHEYLGLAETRQGESLI